MDSLRRCATAAAVLLLCAPLAAGAGFRCPAKGGPEWREYRSKHFVVQTDAERFKVALLVAQLESMHVLELQALVGEQVEIPGHLRVIAFANPALFTDFAGEYQIGGYYTRTALGEPVIALPIEGLEAAPETVAHEIAHYLSTFLFPRQPAWFSEGLAQFVQTVAESKTRIEPQTGSHLVRGSREHLGQVGVASPSIRRALQEARRVSFSELVRWNGRHDVAGASYHLYGWLLYHWLWNQRSKEFTAFQQRLTNGDDPTDAWRASFPDMDPADPAAVAKVDDALEQYRRFARYAAYSVESKADSSFEEGGPIRSADVHMLMREVSRSWSVKEQVANLDEALSEDDSQPSAIVARARLDKALPLARLRKAVTVRAGDWRAWFLLATVLADDANDEKEAAYRKAVALNPDSALAQNGLAWLLATHGRAKEALPIANRALDLAPDQPALIDTLAFVAAELGKCSEALVLERRAAGMVPASSEFAIAFNKRIKDWEARCGAATPAAANVVPAPAR